MSTGSLWGCAESNRTECCYGCGQEQEEFYNCADVSVTPATGKKDEQFKKRQQYEELKFRRYQRFSLLRNYLFTISKLFGQNIDIYMGDQVKDQTAEAPMPK